MFPFRNFKCSKHLKFAVPTLTNYIKNENENLGWDQLMNFLTDSLLIILQEYIGCFQLLYLYFSRMLYNIEGAILKPVSKLYASMKKCTPATIWFTFI
jgi:hypothetical protein